MGLLTGFAVSGVVTYAPEVFCIFVGKLKQTNMERMTTDETNAVGLLKAESRVFNQDCLELMRSLPDGFFHLAVADPPYGFGDYVPHDPRGRYGGRFDKYRETGERTPTEWDTAPSAEFFAELRRVSRHQIIWGANFFDAMPACKCFLVWVKTNIPDGFSMAQAEYAWTSLTVNSRVWHGSSARCKTDGDVHFHPTEKPVALYRWLFDVWMQTLPRPLDAPLRVFDPMMGSQSSRIAAHALGLNYWGCELDAEYFRRGCLRYEQETAGLIPQSDGSQVRQLSLF